MTQPQIKMLSIDDRMLTSELDRAGYRNMGILVKQVASFAEAQDILSSETIDIIVINLDYEKIDALTICRHFKSTTNIAQLPVVLTSVQTSAAVRKKSLDAGADLFVEQPLPRQYFIEKLKKLLDQMTRANDRVDLKETVKITFSNREFDLPIGDISSSGMLVATELDFPDGAVVNLSFLIPGYKKAIECSGTVVRTIRADGNTATKATGVGIRFEKFDGDSEKRLERYIAKTSDKDGRMIYYL
jgi:CheY-like chemotaxis protein